MSDFGELEIWLDRAGQEYSVQLRFRQASSEADRVLPPASTDLDLATLMTQDLDPVAYGRELGKVFSDEAVRKELDAARAVCESSGVPLRVRLFVGPGAPELHAVRWETLADDRESGSPLFIQDKIHFSRYLTSQDWRPVQLRPRAELRVLVAVASPSDLDRFPALAPIDAGAIVERLNTALGGIPATYLTGPGEATLDRIMTELADGYDLLFLAAHGALLRNEPHLWLVSSANETDNVKGQTLVEHVQKLSDPPGAVVLASCQSSGTGDTPTPGAAAQQKDWGALAALGPRLSAAGIPAVVAMQGNLSMETEAAFMPVFFKELSQDGSIDRAVAVARLRVKEHPDWWMPVLFTRLRGGRIWYQQGFGQGGDAQDKWPAIVRHINRSSAGPDEGGGGGSSSSRRRRRRGRTRSEGGCTPLLGPGLLEPYVGRMHELAAWLAEEQSFPMAHYQQEQLPYIAQFVDVKVEHRWLHRELEAYLCKRVIKRHGAIISEDLKQQAKEDPFLGDLLLEVSKKRAEKGKVNAHQLLADLNLPLYLSTSPDNLLADTLEAQGKEPVVDICRWNEELVHDPEPVFEPAGEERPTPKRPLVYHLFGHLDDPKSLVLSEDDHFDFITGFTRNKEHVPPVVRAALSGTALLFAGFRLEDWSFRVLFRAIMNRDGLQLSDRLSHISAQVEPEESRLIDPAGTRNYLQKYLGTSNISLYWGDAEAFLTDLAREMEGGQ